MLSIKASRGSSSGIGGFITIGVYFAAKILDAAGFELKTKPVLWGWEDFKVI
jgi:hypothetical protein